MRRLFEALDVDYDQWLALTRVALKIDLRASTFVRGSRGRQARAVAALISQLIFYTFTGGVIAAFVWFGGDLFMSATLVVGYVMFMVGTATLLDHNAAITSPDDYSILGFRPVTSRTYFAARLTNVLVYTTAMTTLFAYLPVVAYFVRWGAAVGGASIVALYSASMLMALFMVTMYAWLLRVVGAARIKRLLSYVQFVMSFLVYGGYFFVSRLLSERMLAALTLPKTVPVLLLPPTWFASYLELAAGRTSAMEVVPAVFSVAALVALAVTVGGRLSLDYADRLGALSTATSTAPKRAGTKRPARAWWFTGGEARAVALLIRSQFANDMKFRMGVLAIVPLTIIYLVMGLSRTGTIGDPFTDARPSQGLSMVTLAMLMFPTMLKMNLGRSDAYRASWIFFATPADRTRLVRAAKNVLVVTFLVPYLLCVAAVLDVLLR